MKFIHAADLHIDSPLRGLEAYDGAPLDQLRGATRAALENLVQLAVEQQVAFVVIAGDLFDGKWQDMRTGLWTATQLRELDRAGIPVFLLQGNHDAASRVRQAITWPANVRVFSVAEPQTFVLDDLKVALHGQGFARESVTADLAAGYPDRLDGYFNIGVLHTSLTGSAEHDHYASTSLAVLLARGYQYWALGHIHARSDPPLSTEPYIAYSGNLQGRHIRETGAKGCLVVTVEEGTTADVTFAPLDTVRWLALEVVLQAGDDRSALLDRVQQTLLEARHMADGRLVAARLTLRGACEAHRWLVQAASRAEIVAEIRNLANDLADDLWIEKIVVQTSPLIDRAALLQGRDLLGELLRLFQAAREDPQQLATLLPLLQPLQDKAGQELQEAGIQLDDPSMLAGWLQQAESLLISRLMEAES